MTAEVRSGIPKLVAIIVISLAVVGYFVGLQSPMNPTTSESITTLSEHMPPSTSEDETGAIPATWYQDMASLTVERGYRSTLAELNSKIDPLAEVKIDANDKSIALAKREQNRAFNGAPPTVPHPTEQISSASCVACHGEGAITVSLRIPRMSHNFLSNCTQCHVENAPQQSTDVLFRENDFVGLEAPNEGPRSYAGAPPQIPHSTWMRSDCMSCHGYAGLQGIRTTHPWRQNCQQCHAPSATLNQTLLASEPQFLTPPSISD